MKNDDPANHGSADPGALGDLGAHRSGKGSLNSRITAALCKAYAREDRRLHGVPLATVQALVTHGLAYVVSRGRLERYALSAEGEQRAAQLTRDLLARRGREVSPAPPTTLGSAGAKVALCDRLVDFLADTSDDAAGALTLDLPASEKIPAGGRVKLERCGPRKFVLCVLQPREAPG